MNYVNKCFLNFFWNFDKNVNLIHLTIQKVSIENRPLMNLNQFIKYEIPKNRKKNNNKIILYENTKLVKEVSLNIVNTANSTNLFFHVEYWNYNRATENHQLEKIDFNYYDAINQQYIIEKRLSSIPIEINLTGIYAIKSIIGLGFITVNQNYSITLFHIYIDPFFIKVEHFFNNVNP